MMNKDENLIGNEKIEEAVRAMQKAPSDESLAHALTVIRHRMQEKGHLVVALQADADGQLSMRPLSTGDGRKWFAAFTSMEEQLKRKDNIVSGFTAEIEQILRMALESDRIYGVILNPWDGPMLLDRQVISLILGN